MSPALSRSYKHFCTSSLVMHSKYMMDCHTWWSKACEWVYRNASRKFSISGGSKGGEHRAHSPPSSQSNALLLDRGLPVATYISLTSHLLPPESCLLASYTTHWSIVCKQYCVATPTIILYSLVPRLFPARRGADDHVYLWCTHVHAQLSLSGCAPPSENPESAPGPCFRYSPVYVHFGTCGSGLVLYSHCQMFWWWGVPVKCWICGNREGCELEGEGRGRKGKRGNEKDGGERER